MDNLNKKERSQMMSKIKSKDTEPEMLTRRFLHGEGFRFRLHYKDLPGKPDIVLPKYKSAIYVNGCFWHRPLRERCSNCRLPKTNKSFWGKKLKENSERDRLNLKKLELQGWYGLTLWECEIKKGNSLELLKNDLNLIKKKKLLGDIRYE